MITILLIVNNQKILTVVNQVFTKVNIRGIQTESSYAAYLKALQYDPSLVIMEMPSSSPSMHIKFLRLVHTNRGIKKKPFILFGPDLDDESVQALQSLGIKDYLFIPLDVKKLFGLIKAVLNSQKVTKESTFQDKNQISKNKLSLLFDKEATVHQKIDMMLSHVGKLLAFPATVVNVLRISQNERSSAGELATVITSDPSVSAEILKLANSVYFSRGSTKKILAMKDAIVRIGFVQTKNAAMSLSVFNVLKDKNFQTGFSHIEYWFHCLGVSVIARMLAKQSQIVSEEDAFIAGLLHDLGVLIYNEFFNELFLDFLQRTTDEGMPFIQCQKEKVGFSHNDLMVRLFEKWNFPKLIVQFARSMASHWTLSETSIEKMPLAAIVKIADIIAKSLQIGHEADCCVESIPNEIFKPLKQPYGLHPSFFKNAYEEINLFNQFLKIDKRQYPVQNDQITIADKVNILCHSFTQELFSPVAVYLQSQCYNSKVVSELDELYNEAAISHLITLTDGQQSVIADIKKIAQLDVAKFSSPDSEKIDASTKNEEKADELALTKAKVLVFDIKEDITEALSNESVVLSRYPVDLRNIDMVLAGLLLEYPLKSPLNKVGSLKPVKHISIDGVKVEKHPVLIAHCKADIRKKYKDIFSQCAGFHIEVANDGEKAFNLARTLEEELYLGIIDFNILPGDCCTLIKKIKLLPHHKRAFYIVAISNPQKERIVQLIKLGVRNFIDDAMPAEVVRAKLREYNVDL